MNVKENCDTHYKARYPQRVVCSERTKLLQNCDSKNCEISQPSILEFSVGVFQALYSVSGWGRRPFRLADSAVVQKFDIQTVIRKFIQKSTTTLYLI